MFTPWQNKHVRDPQKKLVARERKLQSETSQRDPREAAAKGLDERVTGALTRGSTGANSDFGSYGAASSTGGPRFTRYATPWWRGSGPYAATWIPHSVSTKRAWGLTGFAAGDPQNCMTSLIRNRLHVKADRVGEQDKVDRRSECDGGRDPEMESRRVRRDSTKRGSFEDVMNILKGKEELARARQKLRDGFMAKSSRASQRTKREQVMAMAKEASHRSEQIFPLTIETVENVAAAIKAVGWSSGDQYVNELKLMHIEAGWEVSQQLNKALVDCKRSLKRDRGPVRRAPEFKLDDIEHLKWIMVCRGPKKTARPALAYAWAVVWMLREIEVSAMKWRDISADWDKKRVSVYIPVSKCDQQALGVRRTLQCCNGKSCYRWCPWRLWTEMWKALKGVEKDPYEFVFQDSEGRKLSKAKMVEGWASVTSEHIQGHSARRSGAMGYVRLGMPIQELAFLGRWKSSVVLTYAEDALQSEPANKNLMVNEPPKTKRQPKSQGEEKSMNQATPAGPPLGTPWLEAEMAEPQVVEKKCDVVVSELPKKLWVASTAYSSRERVWHQVEDAGWDVPIESWTSICGWPFSRNSSKVMLNSQLSLSQRKCKKCLKRACGGAREMGSASLKCE